MEKILKENIVKNVILIILFILLYNPILRIVAPISGADLGTLSMIVSILILGSMFGNFTFSYDRSNLKNVYERYLAHLTTGILMFTMGLLFEFTVAITINIGLGNNFLPITVLIYIAMIGYDFWDLLRGIRK